MPAPRPARPVPPPPAEPREGYTAVGLVLRPHGLRGELRVQPFNPEAPNLQPGRTVYLAAVPRRIQRARSDRGAWILQLTGLTSRTAVDGLNGQLVEVSDKDLIRPDADSYFVHELLGMRVVTEDGDDLGMLTEVLQAGAADVYVAKGERGEALFPAIGDVISEIDIANRVIRIKPTPGLLDDLK